MQQNPVHEANSVDSLKSWLINWMTSEMEIDRASIDPTKAFLSYGMDSVQAMTMVGDLEAKLGLRLPPTLAWDYPDIEAMSAHLADRLAAASAPASRPEPPPATSPAEIKSLLNGVDTLGDRDVEGLLNQYVDRAQ